MKDIIAALLGALAQPQLIAHEGKELAALPPNWSTHDLESLRAHPDRVNATINTNGMDSFTAYVNRFKDGTSSVFVNPNLTQLQSGSTLATAYLDYHTEEGSNGGAEASWLGHTATLFARPSLPYAKLLNLDGKMLDQPSFAQALEDIARFSNTHAAGDLLDIARTISLTSKGDFKSFEDEFSGSVDFKFDLAVRASAGTQERRLSVPSHIGFEIPLIDGLTPTQVQA